LGPDSSCSRSRLTSGPRALRDAAAWGAGSPAWRPSSRFLHVPRGAGRRGGARSLDGREVIGGLMQRRLRRETGVNTRQGWRCPGCKEWVLAAPGEVAVVFEKHRRLHAARGIPPATCSVRSPQPGPRTSCPNPVAALFASGAVVVPMCSAHSESFSMEGSGWHRYDVRLAPGVPSATATPVRRTS
jgi:hypothetical protein